MPFIAGEFSSGSHITERVADGVPEFIDLCPVALLAFESAGQVCLSRALSIIELPTIVLSTLYHDFTADLYGIVAAWKDSSSLFDFVLVKYRRQEKRLMSIFALFIGALAGGEMYKLESGMAGALWLAAGLKGAVCVAWCLWKKDTEDEEMLPK